MSYQGIEKPWIVHKKGGRVKAWICDSIEYEAAGEE